MKDILHMISTNGNGGFDAGDVKRRAAGRWRDVLAANGFSLAELDGRHHACPKCGGDDRFSMVDEAAGAVLCRQCFAEKNGDGLAAIQWRNDWTFSQTLAAVAACLGMEGGKLSHLDIIADMARLKRMPADSFRAFGAKSDRRGNLEVARVPMYSQYRNPCSYFDLANISPEFAKGMSAKGQPVGLFVATWPTDGDTVCLVEGVKDAAALHGLGFLAVGLPGSKMAAKFARVFAGCNVIVIPDRDTTGEDSAQITAARLSGGVASVRVATLPGELVAKDGHGVREVLAAKDGEAMLRQAVADAKTWVPEPEAYSPPAEGGDSWTDIRFGKGRTDRANSRRFLNQFRDKVRFCHAWGVWLIWDEMRWKIDADGAVMRLSMSIADSVWFDARDCMTKDIVDFAVSTSGAGKLSAMLKLAAADVPIAVDELDANPWLLNCPNGTLDLRTGKLRPHRREDCLTKLCPTNFNPEADSNSWDRFLDGVFGDSETVEFVRRFAGYCLTGDVSEQILAVLWGVGSNGKSTFLTAFQDALGPDYSMAAPSSLLTVKKNDTHPTELADLFGMRFVVSQETEAGNRLAESLVKSLTGGDKIRARRMRENFWQFNPTHKLTVCTNHKPRVRGTDHAIWRRLVLIAFARKFWNADKGETGPDELKQDKALPAKLKAESEGILAWAVQGVLDWQRGGLRIPESVRASTEEYRTEQDALGRFISECCLTGPAFRVKFSTLFDALEKWANDGGDNLPNRRFVGSWLKDGGFREHSNNGRWYLGLALKAENQPGDIGEYDWAFNGTNGTK